MHGLRECEARKAGVLDADRRRENRCSLVSRQDYGTPWEFIRAVEARFGKIACDLAAHAGNAKADTFLTAQEDSLSVPWADLWRDGTLWLNPEFAKIDPWAEKCAAESVKRGGLIVMLTPASIGTDWFANHVNR